MTTPLGPSGAILYGTLTVGTLDILDAIVFFGLRSGAPPIRIFQSIAAGLLGRKAFEGGLPTALLGGLLHFFIAFVIVCVYYLASRGLGLLTRRAVRCGLLYGVIVYVVMNRVVLPLSAVGTPHPTWPVLINGLVAHTLFVGLPAALFARWSSEAM